MLPCIATAAIGTCLGLGGPELAVVAELDTLSITRLPAHAVVGWAVDEVTGGVFPPGAALPSGRPIFASVRIALPDPDAGPAAVLDVLAQLAANGWRIELQAPLGAALARTIPLIHAAPADLVAVGGGDGAGVMVGVVDFGCDFAHPAFRTQDGRTRLAFLWDQTSGRRMAAAEIDRALAPGVDDPYAALGYWPDRNVYLPAGSGHGAPIHGTHVLGVAAGRGTADCPAGVAPAATLAFVHLQPGALVSSGDPADVFDGVCAIFHHAALGGMPAVVNLSLGANAGSHDGNTAFDRALDALLEAPGRAIVVAAGNEREGCLNLDAPVQAGAPLVLEWRFDAGDVTPNTLRILCDAPDGVPHLRCRLQFEGVTVGEPLGPSANAQLLHVWGRLAGVLYCGMAASCHAGSLQQIELRLIPSGAAERWEVVLETDAPEAIVVDAWIDRDDQALSSQSTFAMAEPRRHSTLTSTACGRRTLCVGAVDPGDPGCGPAPFSAEGPTRDGRQKPDLAAPGIGVIAASAYGGRVSAGHPWVMPPAMRMSGTSVAAPHAAGVAALLLQRWPGLTAEAVSDRLRRSAAGRGEWHPQMGYGRIDAAAALAAR